ncbi:MAG TPA: hypothetical protein VIS06_19185 [Mycobacteriales bacterium]
MTVDLDAVTGMNAEQRAAHAAGQQVTTDGLTPEQIVEELEAGRLQYLLSGKVPATVPAEGQLTTEHLATMTPAQRVEAYEAGRFDDILGRTTRE